MNARWRMALAAVLFLVWAGGALGQELTATLSGNRIQIKSNFSGETLAVFGVIEDAPKEAKSFDAVVIVRGPRGAVTVRRKQQWGPFWFNLDKRNYIAIPAFIAILSNRPVQAIASAAVRDDLRIDMESLIPPQAARRGANDPEFRAALRRLREKQGLFFADAQAVKFVSARAFKATISIPGTVPLGNYDVDVVLFSDGALVARKALKFDVVKSDAEQIITRAAYYYPLAYGILISLMALLLGWIASVIFRRD